MKLVIQLDKAKKTGFFFSHSNSASTVFFEGTLLGFVNKFKSLNSSVSHVQYIIFTSPYPALQQKN